MGPDLFTLALHRISFLTTAEKQLLHEAVQAESALRRMSAHEISRLIGRSVRADAWKPSEVLREAEGDAEVLLEGEIGCISVFDPSYPPQLAEIFDPPFLLFYRGSLPDNTRPALAVVGTRYPSSAGLDAAFDLSFQAADAGISVVSGLALGIDTAAHQGALHSGGYTIAVLGCGCDTLYPRSSAPVGRGILASGGCIVSEFPPGTAPRPYHFPQRNRIISGLSRGTVVVQAPERSGALITADFALEQGRDLFVYGGLLESSGNLGCRELAASGAPAVVGVSDVLKEWGISVRRGIREASDCGDSVGVALAGMLE